MLLGNRWCEQPYHPVFSMTQLTFGDGCAAAPVLGCFREAVKSPLPCRTQALIASGFHAREQMTRRTRYRHNLSVHPAKLSIRIESGNLQATSAVCPGVLIVTHPHATQ
jgi:hypothetical protein